MKVTRCIDALLFLDRELESDKILSSLCLRPQACRSHHTAFSHCPIYVRCHAHLRIQKSAKCLDSYGPISECSVFVAHSSKRNYDVPSPLSSDVSNGNVQFVGKTIESFKLADLYWLDSRVMAFCNQNEKKRNKGVYAASEVRKLAFHRPTASYLLGYSTSSNGEKCDKNKKLPFLPFRSHRFQYVAEVVASGRTPEEFINNVELQTQIKRDQFPKFWTLDHDIFEPYQDHVHHKRNFTSNMLICSLSRVLPPEPALSFQEKYGEFLPYVIIETSSRFYLGQKISRNDLTQISEKKITGKEFRSSWSQRPFPYSGAINLDIAFVVIEILKDLVGVNSRAIPLHREGCKVTNRRLRIIDPTCGSGTFLGVALMVWGDEQNVDLEVVGVDSNPKCSLGTARNLKTMFLQEDSPMKEDGKDIQELNVTSSVKATVYTGDSTDLISLFGEEKFDCGVANLPWNRNTYEFRNEDNDSDESNTNYKILEAVRSILKTGAPLVVISGERKNDNPYFDTRQCLIDMGFDVIGQVSVPPAGFSLPKSEKKNTNRDREQGEFCEVSTRRSDCVITVATVPSTSND